MFLSADFYSSKQSDRQKVQQYEQHPGHIMASTAHSVLRIDQDNLAPLVVI